MTFQSILSFFFLFSKEYFPSFPISLRDHPLFPIFFTAFRYFDGVQWVAHGCWTWLVWAYEEWGGIEYHW